MEIMHYLCIVIHCFQAEPFNKGKECAPFETRHTLLLFATRGNTIPCSISLFTTASASSNCDTAQKR